MERTARTLLEHCHYIQLLPSNGSNVVSWKHLHLRDSYYPSNRDSINSFHLWVCCILDGLQSEAIQSMGKIIQVITGAWYHLWKDFDIGHSLIPPVQVGIAWLYPTWWMVGFNFLAALIFIIYQVQEYYEKRYNNPTTADRSHLAMKGYMVGLVISLAVVAIAH